MSGMPVVSWSDAVQGAVYDDSNVSDLFLITKHYFIFSFYFINQKFQLSLSMH